MSVCTRGHHVRSHHQYTPNLTWLPARTQPSLFVYFFNIITSWLDPVTKEKVKLLGGPKHYTPVLAEHFDLGLLPKAMGGTARLRGAASFATKDDPALEIYI